MSSPAQAHAVRPPLETTVAERVIASLGENLKAGRIVDACCAFETILVEEREGVQYFKPGMICQWTLIIDLS
jgi:hypothetical protein